MIDQKPFRQLLAERLPSDGQLRWRAKTSTTSTVQLPADKSQETQETHIHASDAGFAMLPINAQKQGDHDRLLIDYNVVVNPYTTEAARKFTADRSKRSDLTRFARV